MNKLSLTDDVFVLSRHLLNLFVKCSCKLLVVIKVGLKQLPTLAKGELRLLLPLSSLIPLLLQLRQSLIELVPNISHISIAEKDGKMKGEGTIDWMYEKEQERECKSVCVRACVCVRERDIYM
jgi:hypothetical protein